MASKVNLHGLLCDVRRTRSRTRILALCVRTEDLPLSAFQKLFAVSNVVREAPVQARRRRRAKLGINPV